MVSSRSLVTTPPGTSNNNRDKNAGPVQKQKQKLGLISNGSGNMVANTERYHLKRRERLGGVGLPFGRQAQSARGPGAVVPTALAGQTTRQTAPSGPVLRVGFPAGHCTQLRSVFCVKTAVFFAAKDIAMLGKIAVNCDFCTILISCSIFQLHVGESVPHSRVL